MDAFVNPFDFKSIFIDFFLGSEQLFIYAFIIIFSYVSARYNFSNGVYLILLMIGAILFSFWLGSAWYFLIIVILGLIIFKIVAGFIVR